MTQELTIRVDEGTAVSALFDCPANARACYVLAHGAGSGMRHAFMSAVAEGLAERGIATLRYQFPYMEHGSKRPDLPPLAHATVRAACAQATRLVPNLALFAGGKSFGGRMTSQAQAGAPIAGVRGLIFVGFPLHTAKQPSDTRAAHLSNIDVPLLFLQGTRDDLADHALLTRLVERLGKRATLVSFNAADHSFHVPKRSGRTDAEVLTELLDAIVGWISTHDANA